MNATISVVFLHLCLWHRFPFHYRNHLMEFTFGLLFTLLKVSLQASVYATFLLLVAKIWTAFAPNSRFAKSSANTKQFWWRSGFAASMILFLIATTYWGSHSFGGAARIPLGYDEAMEEFDNIIVYFAPDRPITNVDEPGITGYTVANDILCAEYGDAACFTYHLKTKQHKTYPDSASYNSFAKTHDLPTTKQFEPFDKHYARYWGGWRFWLLA